MYSRDTAVQSVAAALQRTHEDALENIRNTAMWLGAKVEVPEAPDFVAMAGQYIDAAIYSQAAEAVMRRVAEKNI